MPRYEVELVETTSHGGSVRFRSGHVVPIHLHLLGPLPIGTMISVDGDPFQGRLHQVFGVLGHPKLAERASTLSSRSEHQRVFEELSQPIAARDRALLAHRVFAAQELERWDSAIADFVRLLELKSYEPSMRHAPLLSTLFARFSPTDAERLIEPVSEALRRQTLDFESGDTRKILAQIPERRWPIGWLTFRSARETSPQILEAIAREAERRASEDKASRDRLLAARDRARDRSRLTDPGEAGRAHPVYRSSADVLRGTPIDRVPHLGASMPGLDQRHWMELAKFCLSRLIMEIDLDETERKAVALIEAGGEGHIRLRAIEALRPQSTSIAFDALAKTAAVLLAPGMRTGRGAKQAARATTSALHAIGRGLELLEALDREMMRLELVGVLERARFADRFTATEQAAFEILARADDHQKPSAWFFRSGERYAFVARLEGSWIFEEGGADEVIASVPDRWFDAICRGA